MCISSDFVCNQLIYLIELNILVTVVKLYKQQTNVVKGYNMNFVMVGHDKFLS